MWTFARIELVVCWLAFLYPVVFRAPHGQKRASVVSAGPTIAGLLLETAGIGMAFALRTGSAPALYRLIPGILLGSLGAAIMFAAVNHLGRQFRFQAGLWNDHRLVRTGPYAVVRHPIYAALGTMLLATVLIWTRWPWSVLSLVVFLAGTEIRVHAEDALLDSRFGAEFRQYRSRVKAYLPLVR